MAWPEGDANLLSPIFIDIEASGITRGCYPIEVGWAQAETVGGTVRLHARSVLVRPTEAWRSDPSRWVEASVAAHGIAWDELMREGALVESVCDVLDAAFTGEVVASDTGAGDWDDEWLLMIYEAAGRARPWDLSETKSGGLVAGHLRSRSLDPKRVRPGWAKWLPEHTHAAAEDALKFAWEWGMAELLAASDARDSFPGTLSDLPALIPPDRWPRPTAESEARMRRRSCTSPPPA